MLMHLELRILFYTLLDLNFKITEKNTLGLCIKQIHCMYLKFSQDIWFCYPYNMEKNREGLYVYV